MFYYFFVVVCYIFVKLIVIVINRKNNYEILSIIFLLISFVIKEFDYNLFFLYF